MQRIGLTGGIAAGKSVAARRLAELGAVVIDSDVLAREAVAPGSAGLDAVVEAFGAGGRSRADGSLDRAGARRGSCSPTPARGPGSTRIVHPIVRRLSAEREAASATADHGAVVVHDIPLLVETGQADAFHVSSSCTPRPCSASSGWCGLRGMDRGRGRGAGVRAGERRRAPGRRRRGAGRHGQRRRPARAGRRRCGTGSRSSAPTSSRPRRP